MTVDRALFEKVEALAEGSGHPVVAYIWVLRVVDETLRRLGREGHIEAAELLEGHRELALREFGPMAYEVQRHWGLTSTSDVGRLVFELVAAGLLGKTEDDAIEAFEDVYDFHDVFVDRYPW